MHETHCIEYNIYSIQSMDCNLLNVMHKIKCKENIVCNIMQGIQFIKYNEWNIMHGMHVIQYKHLMHMILWIECNANI